MRRLYGLFFLSGATALVYESVWSRELHLVFGTSQFAIATVLAAFMTGLAFGGALASRYAGRITRPLRVYAILELAIGLYALGFPAVRGLLEPLYLGFHHALSPGPVSFGVFQFGVLGVALLFPTACMGATLPVLLRFVAPAAGTEGRAVGSLYAINTLGAVFGTWLVGFWLLPELGVVSTPVGAAVATGLLAVLAWRLDARGRTLAEVERADGGLEDGGLDDGGMVDRGEVDDGPVPPWTRGGRFLFMAALGGFAALALEVAWFRLLALVLGASTYAFTVMLLAFLIGISLGGGAGGFVADRAAAAGLSESDKRRRLLVALALAQGGMALLTWGTMWAWPRLPVTFAWMYFAITPWPELLWAMKCLLAMLVMTPAALFSGATFPLITRALSSYHAGGGAGLSRTVARVYASNTLGSLLGAFTAGFVLLPGIRVTGTVLLVIAVNLVGAGIALASVETGRVALRRVFIGAPALAALITLMWTHPPPWDPMIMTSGMYKYVDNLEAPTQKEIYKRMVERYHLLWYDEGLSSVVTVARNSVTGNIWLANNGKIDASTTTDMPTQVLVAHTPMLFTGDRARTGLLIGLASGITLGAMNLHPEFERIDVAEIEPNMPYAARLFANYNHDALNDPRVHLLANDGRNQLLLTPPGTYDVIVAEPSNPWLTGVSNLFTEEFFRMGKSRLAPHGIWSQWVQMYGMDSRDLRAVIRTFCTVFPHVLLFSTIRDADLVMIGSEEEIVMTASLAQALVHKNVGMESEMLQIGVSDGYDLLSHYLFDRDIAMKMSDGVPLNTDDNLLVEYSAPKNLHRETSTENFLMLLPHARAPLESVPDADGLLQLARAYAARDDIVRALIALKEAEHREPGRADTLLLYNTYQTKLKTRIQ